MSDTQDRERVIGLLNQLGSDDDDDVLAAARELHAHITAADLDWDDLLDAGAFSAASETDEAPAPSADGEATAPTPSSGGKKGRDAETLALINELLAAPGRSEPLREELEEYKTDIANGEFAARDHQYVRALYNRLIG